MAIEKAIDRLEAEKSDIMKLWLKKREEQQHVDKTFNFVRWNDLDKECLQLADRFNSKNKQLEPLKQYLENENFLKKRDKQKDALLARLRTLQAKQAGEDFLSAAWQSYGEDIKQVQADIAHIDQELHQFIQINNTACIIIN